MSNQRKKQVDQLLQSTEECKLVAELTHTNPKSGSTAVIFLALVMNKLPPSLKPADVGIEQCPSYALFFLEASHDFNDVLRVVSIYPLTTDFGVKIVGEVQFDIFFRNTSEVYSLTASTVGTMWTVISALTKAYQLACKGADRISHAWVVPYLEKYGLPKDNISEADLQRAAAEGVPQFETPTKRDGSFDKPRPSLDAGATSAAVSPVKKPSNNQGERMKLQSKAAAKEDWIKKQLKKKESEFIEFRQMTCVLGTWNVNQKAPTNSLAEWLKTDQFEADVYAIGLQEVDMTAAALLKEETEAGKIWSQLIKTELSKCKAEYEEVLSRQLVGLWTGLYVKKEHMPHLKDARIDCQRVGVMGMGNKGGVSIRCKLYESTFCFINSHFAPHDKEVERRNQNMHDILVRTTFGGGKEYAADEHDFLFWFGDLNYRINLDDATCKNKIKEQAYADLLNYDQLTIEKKAGRVFEGFTEATVNFAPTYKYDPGTDIYDTSEKKRIPAWCDRVLWKVNSNYTTTNSSHKTAVRNKFYDRSLLNISDHKPVSAGFDVDVKMIIQAKYKACYMELIKNLDRMANKMLPSCTLDTNSFTFENVRYNVPQTKTLAIENTGEVVLEFNFKTKPNEDQVAKPWLQIEPYAGIVSPGEKAEIKFTVWVDNTTAPALNNDEDTIEDILVLHLENGRDHFLMLSGNFLKSCFGHSLESLVCMHGPVRDMTPEKLQESKGKPKLKVPKELWRLVDYIYKHGMREDGIFQESGNPRDFDIIREKLDTGESFADFDGSVHSVAEALIQFLDSLSTPVIPFQFYRPCLDSCMSAAKARSVVSQLPPVHYNVFHYLMAFLREILYNADANKLTPEELAIGFSNVILKSPEGIAEKSINKLQDQKSKVAFMMHFLRENSDWAKSTDDLLMDT